MRSHQIEFRDVSCFGDEWCTLGDSGRRITLIIGRNNVGKSRLVHHSKLLVSADDLRSLSQKRVTIHLTDIELREVFQRGQYIGGRDEWLHYGRHFVGKTLCLTFNGDTCISNAESIVQNSDVAWLNRADRVTCSDRLHYGAIKDFQPPFDNSKIFAIKSERDVRPERMTSDLTVSDDGSGATNLIRKFLHTQDDNFRRELITQDVLTALNSIFEPDSRFSEIDIQHNDASNSKDDPWEIVFTIENRKRIPIGKSGSGLKTVILVLINLLVLPALNGQGADRCIFVFEELENNLHPALQRRLIEYIFKHVKRYDSHLFLTTHSSVILDAVMRETDSQVLLVSRKDGLSSCRTISSISDKIETLYELGSRPSDLLQANGIIWLEGPSDRIYFNRWIELISEGKLLEGHDYQCAFYGGALLARHSADVSLEDQTKFVDLLKINTNLVLICDSDRASSEDPLKERVTQIQDALRKFSSSLVWVLDAREVENYLTPVALTSLNSERSKGGTDPLPELGKYDNFWTRKDADGYLKRYIGIASEDKVKLAMQLAPQLTLEDLRNQFDWFEKMTAIRQLIERWNQ